jgi:hypothetical protein
MSRANASSGVKFHAMTLLKFKLAARVQQRITLALETDSSLA